MCGIYIVHGILISDSNPLWNCLFYFCPYYPFRMRIYEFTFFDVNGSLKKIIAYEDETCQTKFYFKKSGSNKKNLWAHNFCLGALCEWSWIFYRHYWQQNDNKIANFLAKWDLMKLKFSHTNTTLSSVMYVHNLLQKAILNVLVVEIRVIF